MDSHPGGQDPTMGAHIEDYMKGKVWRPSTPGLGLPLALHWLVSGCVLDLENMFLGIFFLKA